MRELIQTVLGFVAILLPFLILLLRRRGSSSSREADRQRGPLTGRPDSELIEPGVRDVLTDTDDPMRWLQRVAQQREQYSPPQAAQPAVVPKRESLAAGALAESLSENKLENSLDSSKQNSGHSTMTAHAGWRRILALTPLQRAIVLNEILGPPKSISDGSGFLA